MAVQNDPLKISPYTSTVPLVQIPPDAIAGSGVTPNQPLQGQFGAKGTGSMAIGDALLKGFIQGHQRKVQQKYAEAQATIAAADAGSEAAYQKYQDALTQAKGNPDDPTAKANAEAAYSTYRKIFDQSKEAKAKFVIPEKPPKGQTAQRNKGEKGEKKTGWNNFKDFFEANPHIVPQIALMTMQPKPPGLAPEGRQAVQNLESQRLSNEKQSRDLANQNTYQSGFSTYAHLSPDEIASLPPDVKKGYEAWQNARAALTPMKFTGTAQLYTLPNGKTARLYKEEQELYYPDAEPYIPSQEVKPGSDAQEEQKYLQGIGKTFETATAEEMAKAIQYAKTAKSVGSSSTTKSTVDIRGNRTSTTTRTPTPGRIEPPPTGSQASKKSAASGAIVPPPAGTKTGAPKTIGVPVPPTVAPRRKTGETDTQYTARIAAQATEKQAQGYQKAEDAHLKGRAAADKVYETAMRQAKDDADLQALATKTRDAAYAAADQQLAIDKKAVAASYDAAVRQIGGTPGDKTKVTANNPPPGATMRYRDSNGNVVGYAVNGQYVPVSQ